MKKLLLLFIVLCFPAFAQIESGGIPGAASKYAISRGPTFTITGACTSITPVGGSTAGTYNSGTSGSCATTIALPTAPNGWACFATDLTTAADAFLQKQTSSTTASATITGTTVSGDVISFNCTGY